MQNYRRIPIVFLASFVATLPASADICISTSQTVNNIGTRPRTFVAVDLDRDGDLDFVASDASSPILNIVRNDGAGGLVYEAGPNLGDDTFGIAAADFNGDGWPDVALSLGLTNKAAVLLNDQTGNFLALVKYNVAAYPLGVAAGDINGDGLPDLAVACGSYPGVVSVLLNQGNGTFAPFTSLNIPADRTEGVVLGDVNGDGAADLVAVNQQSHNVAVLINSGDGSFGAAALFSTANFPNQVGMADIDGVNGSDLLVPSGDYFDTAGKLTVLFNDGSGGFGGSQTHDLPGPGYFAAARDLNADGATDVLCSYYRGDNTATGFLSWINDGSGGLQQTSDVPLPAIPFCIDALDLNGSGSPSAVAMCDAAHSLVLVPPSVPGVYLAPETLSGLAPEFVAADLSGDGQKDLVWPVVGFDATTRGILVALNDGAGAFVPSIQYDTLRYANEIIAADMDSDGDLDLVVQCEGFLNEHQGRYVESGISVLENNGDGTFAAPRNLLTGSSEHVTAVTAGDFDGDGLADIVAQRVYPSVEIRYVQNLGGFAFAAPVNTGIPNVSRVFAADLDSDGQAELVVSVGIPLPGKLDIYEFISSAFSLISSVPTGKHTQSIAFADVTRDHVTDIVHLGESGGFWDVAVATGNGDGTFASPPLFLPLPTYSLELLVSDMNGDLSPDLAISTYFNASVNLYENPGRGDFDGTYSSVTVGDYPLSLARIDRNGDGQAELYVGFDTSSVLVVPLCDVRCRGDVNDDGAVDLVDLSTLLSNYGLADGALYDDGDLDGDGDIDLLDLASLLAAYGRPCG